MNILVNRRMALGDVLCITPVLARLRRENPEAHIVVSTGYPNVFADNPHINSVNTRRGWDRVIDLDMVHERTRHMHAIDAYMTAAFGDTGEEHDKSIVFPFDPPARSESRVAMLHANASWRNRTMPNEWWDEVARRLNVQGYETVALGTGIDYCPKGALDTRNTLDLKQQAQAIQSANVFVCGASGLFILAAATTTPVVVPLTINKPKTALPWRHGVQGSGYFPVVATVGCVGCSERAGPVTYLECEDDNSYACIPTILAASVASVAGQVSR